MPKKACGSRVGSVSAASCTTSTNACAKTAPAPTKPHFFRLKWATPPVQVGPRFVITLDAGRRPVPNPTMPNYLDIVTAAHPLNRQHVEIPGTRGHAVSMCSQPRHSPPSAPTNRTSRRIRRRHRTRCIRPRRLQLFRPAAQASLSAKASAMWMPSSAPHRTHALPMPCSSTICLKAFMGTSASYSDVVVFEDCPQFLRVLRPSFAPLDSHNRQLLPWLLLKVPNEPSRAT